MRLGLALPVLSCTAFLVSLVGGCNPSTRTPTTKPGTGDPLVGEVYPKKYELSPGTGRTTKAGGLPPYPAATGATAPAALTGGKDLAMPGVPGTPSGDWQAPGKSPGTVTSGPREGVKLLTPTPVVDPGAGTQARPQAQQVVPVGTWQRGPAAGGDEYDQLQAALRARGVTWQMQETYQDGFKFTCSVPNPASPEFSRTYEATARDYKSAILAVIEQIDRKR